MQATILIIEDDRDLVHLLCASLEPEGYRIVQARDGVDGFLKFREQLPDLILLDLLLPRMDGWETCRRIREHSEVPIIILSSLVSEQDIVRGLELGADDYISKPYRLSELKARIWAALRRYKWSAGNNHVLEIDEHLSVDREKACLIVDSEYVKLSPVEFKLLDCFLDNPGRVLTHQSLLTQVWGWEYIDEVHYLKVYVYQLRKKMEREPQKPSYILTERGLGYRFQPPNG